MLSKQGLCNFKQVTKTLCKLTEHEEPDSKQYYKRNARYLRYKTEIIYILYSPCCDITTEIWWEIEFCSVHGVSGAQSRPVQ